MNQHLASKTIPWLIGMLSVLVGGLVLGGWWLDIAVFKSLRPDWVTMKANTALSFILAGLSLMATTVATGKPATRVVRLCALPVALIGVLTLIEYVAGVNLGIDQLFFDDQAGAVGTSHPGRMAMDTATCFTLLAAALWLTGTSRSGRTSLAAAILSTLTTTIALASLLSLVVPTLGPIGWWGFTIMAVHTAVLFMALGVAVYLAVRRYIGPSWVLGQWPSISFVGGMVILIFIGLTTSRGLMQMNRTDRHITKTEKFLHAASHILIDVANAQSSTRGYLLTGEDRFVDVFTASKANCGKNLAVFQRLTAGSPHHKHAGELERLIVEAFAWWQQSIDTHRVNMAAVVQRTRISQGEYLMDRISAAIAEIQNENHCSFEEHQQESDQLVTLTHGLVLTGTFISLAIFLAVFLRINHAMSERQRMEDVLRESEGFYRSLFDNMLNGFAYCQMLFDRDQPQDFIYLSVNKAFETLTGLQDVIGKKVSEVIPGIRASDPIIFEIYGRVATTGKPEKFETYVTALKMWFAIAVYSPRPGYFVAVFDVTTERKLAEAQLQHLMGELKRSNQELEQFAYVASHDLQEPLRMVASYTQLLAQRYENQLDDKAQKYIAYAVDGATRMQRLINDLLAYSRINIRGKPPEQTDLNTVLGEALRNLSAAIEKSRATVTSDDLPTVRADPTQLLQLFQNLIGNGIKFRKEEPPHIHVAARDLGHEWCFSVQDNGIGIDARYADKLFVIFQRLHTRQEYPGTGIGLALCKRIAERHGGSIWFESAPENGSTFYFTLPKEKEVVQ